MRPKRWLDRPPMLNASGIHDQMGSITAEPAEEMRSDWDARRDPVTIFIPRYRLQSFKVAADIPNQDEMTIVILW